MLEPDKNLPNETLVHIFSHLSQHDLTKVALLSHHFNAIAERLLYSSIDIAEKVTESSDVPKRTLGWCDAMKRNQLYDKPRKLSIRWLFHKTNPTKSKTLPHSCSLVGNTIRRLTLLDTLELFMGPSSPAVELVIRDLRLPNLRHCLLGVAEPDWRLYYSFTPKPCNMHAFIASHSGLCYLAVLEISEPAMELVPHDAVPELSIFCGTASGAASILPGRPVHHLLLIGMGFDLSNENLPRMSFTSVPLRILDLSAMSLSASVLRDIATHLPTIEIIRVRLALGWGGTGIEKLSALSSYLALFKKLNWFDLSLTFISDLGTDDQRSLCYDWHSVCPSLRHIFFPFDDHPYDAEPAMWKLTEDWFPCELPTRESADGLYRYTPRSRSLKPNRFGHFNNLM